MSKKSKKLKNKKLKQKTLNNNIQDIFKTYLDYLPKDIVNIIMEYAEYDKRIINQLVDNLWNNFVYIYNSKYIDVPLVKIAIRDLYIRWFGPIVHSQKIYDHLISHYGQQPYMNYAIMFMKDINSIIIIYPCGIPIRANESIIDDFLTLHGVTECFEKMSKYNLNIPDYDENDYDYDDSDAYGT